MPNLTTLIKYNQKQKSVSVELNASQFERMAANFGFFGLSFLKSLDSAEADYKSGRVKKIKSLRELRAK